MGWILDLDGVLWLGGRPIAGAAEAVAALRAAGERVAFVTNNSSRPRAEVGDQLAAMGVDPGDDVLTSAMAVGTLLTPGTRVLVCAGPGVREAVLAAGAEPVQEGPADAVVVGYHRSFDYDGLTAAVTAVRNGARLLATNDDATYPTEHGLLPGGGALLAAVVTAAGRGPDAIAGKPHTTMAALARGHVGDEGWVVGDRPDTDGRFATTLGFSFGLVLSGVTVAEDLPVQPTPAAVGQDLAALVAEVLA